MKPLVARDVLSFDKIFINNCAPVKSDSTFDRISEIFD